MEIIGIQIASVGFSLFMSYLTYLYYKRSYFGLNALIIWLVIFFLFTVLTLFPKLLQPFAVILKVARIFDLFVIIGMTLLLSLAYINFISLQAMKKKLEKLIQSKALEDHHDEETSGETS